MSSVSDELLQTVVTNRGRTINRLEAICKWADRAFKILAVERPEMGEDPNDDHPGCWCRSRNATHDAPCIAARAFYESYFAYTRGDA